MQKFILELISWLSVYIYRRVSGLKSGYLYISGVKNEHLEYQVQSIGYINISCFKKSFQTKVHLSLHPNYLLDDVLEEVLVDIQYYRNFPSLLPMTLDCVDDACTKTVQ